MCIYKNILPKSVIKFLRIFILNYITKYHIKSYSQEGEDMILNRLFEYKNNGFYVDIGAHHPFRFSNTYLFYKKGWRGINVDAMPNSMKVFNKFRPRDINIECGVANISKLNDRKNKRPIMTYYIFNEPALNGFNVGLEEKFKNHPQFFLERKVQIPVFSLEEILENNLPKNTTIDFMSIDVEGLDYEVLQSNNFEKYRPNVLLVEAWESGLDDIITSEIYTFLKNKKYDLYAKSVNTLFFKSRENM
ncbi:methyltransferase%2C FkbM family [Campylobacter hyointestinalis subsp. hyointestinalis]|uniref:Methyltransferase, FkbM family n=1 Tax=Campylobacter hyointestinalis subsp. hyointestinalis TaxID=91352 RepID=A0A0S4S3A6_CAMHY|nr:FkbM family methyltransferase [Campylobacter hyointestinalis]PPB53525.1 SAM-dependent methyltransferase [Campylobacter hyointestinalis subsp. hyointestinalis]PPB66246.1 SAM-dependent methyltransferase [Campylobacter hyointestinalis subsp. hyointestinalis]PPB70962.1 SAM-dependent methyltransferase [Campylobacter hyointestinalis subsp. hyointestinalis]CUU79955.1 methyltransferase%2C FkbM family [Campylobacter hyointestinalis subsp. hyointestinalis]